MHRQSLLESCLTLLCRTGRLLGTHLLCFVHSLLLSTSAAMRIHKRRGFSMLLRSRTCSDLGGNSAPGGTHGAHPCHVWNGNTESLRGYAHVYLSLPPKCRQKRTQFASGRKIKHDQTMKIKWNMIFLCQVKNWSMDWHLDLWLGFPARRCVPWSPRWRSVPGDPRRHRAGLRTGPALKRSRSPSSLRTATFLDFWKATNA